MSTAYADILKAAHQIGTERRRAEAELRQARQPPSAATTARRLDDDEHDDRDEAAARGRERGRIRAILMAATPHNYDQACKLAFETRMTRGEAIAVLSGMKPPAATEQPLADATAMAILAAAEMARAGGPERPAPSGLAAAIVAAGEKRRQPRGD
jgi:hypothetical protein